MTKPLIQKILKDPGLLSKYSEAVQVLRVIGFFDWMMDKARPQIVASGSDVQVMATQAARSAGYFEALEDIIHFEEQYIAPYQTAGREELIATYGGVEIALKEGFITKEEANDLYTK